MPSRAYETKNYWVDWTERATALTVTRLADRATHSARDAEAGKVWAGVDGSDSDEEADAFLDTLTFTNPDAFLMRVTMLVLVDDPARTRAAAREAALDPGIGGISSPEEWEATRTQGGGIRKDIMELVGPFPPGTGLTLVEVDVTHVTEEDR